MPCLCGHVGSSPVVASRAFSWLRGAGFPRWLLSYMSRCFGVCGLQKPWHAGSGAQAQQSWRTGSAALQRVGPSGIRERAHVSCTGRRILCRDPREAPDVSGHYETIATMHPETVCRHTVFTRLLTTFPRLSRASCGSFPLQLGACLSTLFLLCLPLTLLPPATASLPPLPVRLLLSRSACL